MLLRGGQYRTHPDHRIDSAMLEFVSVAVRGISFVYAGFRGLRDYLQKSRMPMEA
jgi:hypothetical protein